MLPPSMIKNSALHGSAGTNSTRTNNRLERPNINQARRSNTPNGANKNDLLQQLRLITSQLPGYSSSAPAPTQRNMIRPEVPQSSVGITTPVANKTSASNPIDVDMVSSTPAPTMPQSPPKTSQTELFPYILHGMLDDVQKIGKAHIVSWNPDGKSFRIHDPDAFISFILGKYFKKYVGGIASRLTQFRSDLKDWGFEDAVDGNGMGETFTHHCFQKGQSNLCRYMRCGRKAVEPARQPIVNNAPASTAMPRPVQAQAQPVPSANTLTLNNAAQLLLQQAKAKQQQIQQAQAKQQQQQQQALQLQALLNGVTNGSNPVATMGLIQLLMNQQQQQPQQQAPSQVMSAAAAMQRQQQTTVTRTPAPILNTQMMKQPVQHLPKKDAAVPQVKRSKPTPPVTVKSAPGAKAAASTKRAAFLNKRSKASGAVYRNPNKKQKRAPSNATAMVIKNRKKGVAGKSSVLASNKNRAPINAFTLNEGFNEKAVSDLLFPWKLHDMLDETELDEDLKTNVVSWQADGVSFNVHDKDRFVQEVIPKYFEKLPKDWDAFLNHLSSWGFVRFTSGTQKGTIIHRLLVRGKRQVCKQMRINGKTVSDWMKQHGQFIGRLHALLTYADKQGKKDIVSWTTDGKKFRIHDPSSFMNTLFPMYFDSLTYGSFEQKLRRWGFMRSPAHHQKMEKGTQLQNATYSHPHFVKGKEPSLVWVKSDTKVPRTLQQHNFLVRLRVMLSDASRHGHNYVISWAPHGKAFMIHDRPYFSNNIMPSYFKSKFTSFRQSLRNHGFAQIGGNGWDEGAYYHKLFLRDEPQLCQGLTQDQMKKAMPEWIPVEDEPNFYPSSSMGESEVAAAASMVSLKKSSPTMQGK